ncbi:aminopeptidase N [Streptomyces sp. CNQ-509]|uniref:aminopeptidase N n=1 Tax=unclassified Streptomyces TaxID=2593676 RepID=UPI00062DE1C8|nr:aminopeptidase N [Streptomyces sp. CNQ-509]AKH81837.1 aminopeptidase N [Streptomyces sp. CNQ-509]
MPALTRAEAQLRADLLDVRHYAVDLDLTRGEEVFGSSTVITFAARTAAETFVEIRPAELVRATLDGRDLETGALDDNRLALQLAEGEHELRVEAVMSYSRTGEGMHRFTDPADGETYVYSQLFLDDVQRAFAAFDQPDLKAVFDVSVTAPAGWTVLGNGIAHQEADAGPGAEPAAGVRWRLTTTPPLATYLVAVAAGPWHSVHTEHAGLPFGLHCRRSLAAHLDADAEELFDVTRRCFDRYHERFAEPYPFDSYDQAFVPEFNANAMENPGLVTFRDEFVYRSAVTDTERQTRAMVIAHEMAHMWFGDLVTLRWWDDIWLNESFAEYMGYQILAEATRFTGTWTDFAIARKSWGYDADQRPSTHPVAPPRVPDSAAALQNFDGISYAKGASALRQLVAWMGEKDFFAGLDDYFSRHRFGNATLADFIASMDRASDRDVPEWADAWLRTTGVDTFRPEIWQGEDDVWVLEVEHAGRRPHRLDVGLYDEVPGEPGRMVLRERAAQEFAADLGLKSASAEGRVPDLVLVNDGDLTYAKIRLDEGSWETALRCLSGIPDPLSRAVLWNAARDMVRDAELPPADYLRAAAAHLPAEDDLAVVQGVLGFARGPVAGAYVPDADRPAARATVAETCRELLRRTDDDHDPGLRLAAVRALIDCADEPDEVRDWLAAGTVPGGPVLDPDLRWRCLVRLAVLGATTPERIEAEVARDPGASAQEGAARCLAALPDAGAKAAAWESMYGGAAGAAELSTYLFTATALGFWQPEQREVLAPYVPRWFAETPGLAGRRGPAIAEAAGRSGFPRGFVDAETLRLGRECLERDDLVPALRRRLADQLDDLGRALRVREAADAGSA